MAGSIRTGRHHRLSLIGPEVPGLFADVLGSGAEDRALDRDTAVHRVIMAGRKEPFNRNSKQHDSSFFSVDVPARDAVVICGLGKSADLEAHFLQFRPRAAQKIHGVADGQIKTIDPALQRRERWAHHLAAAQPSVAPMARTAARSCGVRLGAVAGHDQSL